MEWRFQQASIWVPKKNKKSPTLAAWGVYLLCGDGEQGQKVFSGAKDGGQAMIAQKHAIAMVQQSPELMDECKIHGNTGSINHIPTRSEYAIMSSGDARHQQSKEGINGSVLIDETHVVDRKFMRRLRYAGISRSEPLRIEVSTAGDDPEGYGKERFDYGAMVERGDAENEGLLYVFYGAPQDLTDEQLDANTVEIGQKANPAWGHTIYGEEFEASYDESKKSLRDMLDFKMYRLNIWQSSNNPWLDSSQWAKCRRDYTEADVIGMRCVGALDLARKSDMTALMLLFEDEDEFRQLPFFWLPEAQAHKWADKASYQQWAKNGYLTLTDGDVADYAEIENDIVELVERFNPEEMAFDPLYATEMMQRIAERTGRDNRWQVEFKQSAVNFAGPTANYERLLGEEKMLHNNHPILNWQAGHVEVKSDANKNIRPVKEQRGSHKSIDGIVSGVMTTGLMLETKQPTGSLLVF